MWNYKVSISISQGNFCSFSNNKCSTLWDNPIRFSSAAARYTHAAHSIIDNNNTNQYTAGDWNKS